MVGIFLMVSTVLPARPFLRPIRDDDRITLCGRGQGRKWTSDDGRLVVEGFRPRGRQAGPDVHGHTEMTTFARACSIST
ncbi:hypothetical protein [Lentzea nigeriaca]|uniref:hypothetical protein n=1 Tax=Lentzea nigeriaca TaxID=1128665 RepID=UPI001957BCBA|nr:hypothetical protein [Lentzea nigeriaca]MBM7856420.1 hypothetical protein [Lentzea nigeriaca]